VPTIDQYLKAPYGRMFYQNDNGTYTGEVLEFTGCFAEGGTLEEANRNLERSIREWIEASLKLRREIPEPFAARGFSGTVSLRIPKGLHRQAARIAEREGVSLNQYFLTAISARVGADDLFNRMAGHASASAISRIVNLTQNMIYANAANFIGMGGPVTISIPGAAPDWASSPTWFLPIPELAEKQHA